MTDATATSRRRLTALLAAVALAILGLFAIPQPALAEGGPANIDPDATIELHIHKYDKNNGEGNWHPDGSGDPGANQKALDGVEFTVWQIMDPADSTGNTPLDMKTVGAWDIMEKITKKGPVYGVAGDRNTAPTLNVKIPMGDPAVDTTVVLKEFTTVTTKDGGKATITADDGLTMGAYLVEETGFGGNLIVEPAQPYIVTVPWPDKGYAEDPNPDTFKWIYKVHTYPKNLTDAASKTVSQDSTRATWTVTQPIPGLQKGNNFTVVKIEDNLSAVNLRYVKTTDTPPVDSWSVVVQKADGTAVTELGSDAWTFTDNGGTITVTLNEAGLTKLNELVADGTLVGGRIVLKFDTEVVDADAFTDHQGKPLPPTGGISDEATGLIRNQAKPSFDTEQGPITVPPPEGDSHWGWLSIFKHDEKKEALSGAVFQVHPFTDGKCDLNTVLYEETSKADGSIGPLVLKADKDTGTKYCYREVKEPAGYRLLGDPIEITVKAGANTDANPVRDFENKQRETGVDLPRLPLTGANGQILMLICGIAVIAIGAGVALRKRNHSDS